MIKVDSNILRRIANVIKPELNLLYTVPPFKDDTEIDCGWFCREHALHCFTLCQMLKLDCTIFQGDFSVSREHQKTLTSVGANSDHAWCGIGDILPLDLSMTLQQFGGGEIVLGPQLASMVCGTGRNGDFDIYYCLSDQQFRKLDSNGPNEIHFIERQKIIFSVADLIDEPFRFLHEPAGMGWAEIHGRGIFSKISLHIFKLFHGRVSPLFPSHDSASALQSIKAQYGGASQKLKNILKVS